MTKFYGSDAFIALNALLAIVAWCFDIWAPLMCVMVAIGSLSLFVCRDTKQMFPALFMFSLTISENHKTLEGYAPMLCLIAVLFAGIIFNFVFYRRKLTLLRPSKIKGFNCSLLALAIPFALGGVGSAYEHPMAVVVALALIVLIGIGYCFFFVTLSDSPDKSELPKYALKVLFAMGIVLSVQLVVYYARIGNLAKIVEAMELKDIKLGWAGPNNVAPTLSMCVPATLYFCIKKSRYSNITTPLLTAIALFEYLLIVTTGCRGAILFTTVALPAMILYVATKSENRAAFCIAICALFAVGAFLIEYFGKTVAGLLSFILNKGLDSSGRDSVLYPEAWAAFRSAPLFGVGWDYRLGELSHTNYTPYWFHSTALQILAMMGLVGIVAFAFFYFWRYRTFLARIKEPAVLSLLAGLALFDAYGMVDTNFFGPTFFMMLLAMTIVVEVGLPENKCRAFGGKDPIADIAKFCKFIARKIAPSGSSATQTQGAQESADTHLGTEENAEPDKNAQREARPENDFDGETPSSSHETTAQPTEGPSNSDESTAQTDDAPDSDSDESKKEGAQTAPDADSEK